MKEYEPMDHEEIEERQVIEHYVAGKLPAADEARFEEHYLTCDSCIRGIGDAERLHRALQTVAAEEIGARTTLSALALRFVRSRMGALLTAASVGLVLLPIGLAWQRIDRLDAALGAAQLELDRERRPRINTPILELNPRIRDGEQPAQRISLPPEPGWLVFALSLGQDAAERYMATLSEVGGETIRVVPESSSFELVPSYAGTLTFSLHSSYLTPGDYILELQPSTVSGDAERFRVPLRIVSAPP